MQPVRTLLSWLAPTRAYAAAFIVVALVGLVSCFVPLVDLLGYESAAVFGVCGGVAALGLTLHAMASGVVAAPLADGRDASPSADFFVLLVRHELLLAAPALLLALNAFRVINCSVGAGVGFWLAIPVPAVFLGQTLAWLAGAAAPRRPRLQLAFCVGAIVLSGASLALHLALQPPITGHQLFLGYFSGSIYDEALSLPTSLVWYRGMHVAAAVAALACIEAIWRRRHGKLARWAVLVALIAAGCAVAIWTQRQELGIRITRGYIQQQLGGRIETEHFVIHYPQTERFIEARQRLAEDHEYRYAEMAAFFHTDPAKHAKIHSYVYADREQKGRLMGGRRTLVAKLWLHEMHILWNHYGDHKLAHELAHIFTEPFGAGPLRLSMQSGVGVNMGLVEGAATAADWPTGELTPHQASAALRRMGLAPDIRQIVAASGFWTQSSGRAYTLVGSFVRYLVDTYGVEKFEQAYPHGDFAGAYGKSAARLVGEWEAFLDEIELSEREMELARFLYNRPTIFEKVCARQIADMSRRAHNAARRGDVGQVTELYEQILDYAPRNIHHRIAYARALSEARQYERASEQVEQMLEAEHPPVIRAELLSLRGDLAWRRGQIDEARAAYRRCLALGVPTDARRLLEVKLDALDRPEQIQRELAFEYLLGQTPGSVSLFFPMQWHLRDNDDALAAYLVGRRLWAAHQWEEALAYLERAQRGVGSGILGDEALRMLGSTEFFVGRLDAARAHFERLASSPRPHYRAEAQEWLDRIAWKRGNRIGTQ